MKEHRIAVINLVCCAVICATSGLLHPDPVERFSTFAAS